MPCIVIAIGGLFLTAFDVPCIVIAIAGLKYMQGHMQQEIKEGGKVVIIKVCVRTAQLPTSVDAC